MAFKTGVDFTSPTGATLEERVEFVVHQSERLVEGRHGHHVGKGTFARHFPPSPPKRSGFSAGIAVVGP